MFKTEEKHSIYFKLEIFNSEKIHSKTHPNY